jgi:hypothetical protein
MMVHDLISRLGGPKALGSKISAAPKTVSMWSSRNAIPRKYLVGVWRLAISEGIDWAPSGADGLTLIPASGATRNIGTPAPKRRKRAPPPDPASTAAESPSRGQAA